MSTPLLPAFVGAPEINRVYHLDLFDLCAAMPAGSVDMILCDLPYGTTACSWDTVIPFAPMWAAFKRIIKPRGAIVLTASQPFTSALVMSNVGLFRYEWIWEKSNIGGYMNAQYMPLDEHESVIVFSQIRARSNQFTDERMNYFPQGVTIANKLEKNKLVRETVFNNTRGNRKGKYHVTTQTGFPKSILRFPSERGLHPTQKPVDLFRYLIRTYTRPGELVFDPCVGSGTTAVAARAEGRRFVVGDSSAEYVQVARDRLAQPYTPMFAEMLA